MLEIRNLTKIYHAGRKNAVTALRQISLSLPDTGMIFLLGKSGSGKTTLLNLIGALDTANEGDILLDGAPFSSFSTSQYDAYRNTCVGFVFQEYNLLEEFSVEKNVALALEMQGAEQIKERVDEALAQVNLQEYAGRKPGELSGGQRQRVAIARTIVKNPRIVLADEPTGALDSQTGEQILTILRKLSEDRLVIVVTHDRNSAEKYADRMIELADGKVLSDSEPRNVSVVSKKTMPLHSGRLSAKSAFRIGWNSILQKKIRFLAVLLLSTISFLLFGMSDMLSNFDRQDTLIHTLQDEDAKCVTLRKEKNISKGSDEAGYSDGFLLSDEEVETLEEKTGALCKGVYIPPIVSRNIEYNYKSKISGSSFDYVREISGFVEFSEDELDHFGCSLVAGKMPDASGREIAISKYLYDSFAKVGYAAYTGPRFKFYTDGNESEPSLILSWDEYHDPKNFREDVLVESLGNETYHSMDRDHLAAYKKQVKDYADLIGENLFIAGRNYTITGIIDTGFDVSRYQNQKFSKEENSGELAQLHTVMLEGELDFSRKYGLSCAVFVGKGGLDVIASFYPSVVMLNNAEVTFQNEQHAYTGNAIFRISDLNRVELPVMNTVLEHSGHCFITKLRPEVSFVSELKQKEVIFPVEDYSQDGTGQTFSMRVSDQDGELTEEGYICMQTFEESGEVYQHPYWLNGAILVSDDLFERLSEGREGVYTYAVSSFPKKNGQIKKFANICGKTENGIRYPIIGAVTFEMNTLEDNLNTFARIFGYAGLGIGIFSVILFFQFISISIVGKKREIGIMRALGAGKGVIFQIFFMESLLLAILTFLLAGAACGAGAVFANRILWEDFDIMLSVFRFGIRQIVLLFGLSIFTAVISSAVPIAKIVHEKPIDAIRI